ncbi:MAG: sugar ABC transporter substrate-binding protein [Clostridiaceae bacterium]|nr:sugar ABC transporter substrate-binding protein [Clostridiaceae bacterium]
MKFKKIIALMLATLMMLSLVACGGGESTSDDSGSSEAEAVEPSADSDTEEVSSDAEEDSSATDGDIQIAYIVKALTDEFWEDMQAGAFAYAEEVGVEIDFQAPPKETDVEQQVNMVENAVVKGYDAIILSAADSKALIPAIITANEADIPVILVNDTIDMDELENSGGYVETYVGIDQYEAASLAGKHAAENIEDGKVAYLEGISGVQALQDRLDGFKDQVSDFEIVASQTANNDRNEGYNVTQNILSANPEVNVIWAVNAEMGQGAIQAIQQGGFENIAVYDFDAASDDIAAVQNGTLTGTVAQYPELQAEGAIQACLDILDGKELEAHTKTKAELITLDNVEEFIANKNN